MKQYLLLTLILPFITSSLKAQAIIKGRVVDNIGKEAIPNAKISIEGDTNKITTDKEGYFEHSKVTFGSKRFVFEAEGYETLSESFDVNKEEIDLGEILLPPQSTAEQEGTLWLTDNDLDEDESISSTATLLQSSRDPYSQAAAFDWGPMWFRNRGYGSDQSRTLFNGIPLDQPSK